MTPHELRIEARCLKRLAEHLSFYHQRGRIPRSEPVLDVLGQLRDQATELERCAGLMDECEGTLPA